LKRERIIEKQQAWIAELETAKAWFQEQRDNWQRLAEERERIIQEQQARIAELEKAKAWFQEQWDNWQRLAEEREPALKERVEQAPALKELHFGGLRRVTPISRSWGYDRGLPIDRYYIENFLACYANDIRGRVLEIGDDSYTRRFGGDRVTTRDVLHVVEDNPKATMVADLTCADHIPSDIFNCVILTQTLHLIYDTRAALRTLHRILKPGGVLLATFPGISQIDHYQWGTSWYWGFTTQSARRLFEEVFPAENVKIQAYGNVLAAISFLHGLAVDELRQEELDYNDPQYELLITVRAVRSEAS
jgi:SAM-dependent methyltransferase